MKKLIVLLVAVAGLAFLSEPKATAGVHIGIGLPLLLPVPFFYGPGYYDPYYYNYSPGYAYYPGYGYYHRGYYGPYWRNRYYGGYYRGYYRPRYYGRQYSGRWHR
jgi:hypothetical protein